MPRWRAIGRLEILTRCPPTPKKNPTKQTVKQELLFSSDLLVSLFSCFRVVLPQTSLLLSRLSGQSLKFQLVDFTLVHNKELRPPYPSPPPDVCPAGVSTSHENDASRRTLRLTSLLCWFQGSNSTLFYGFMSQHSLEVKLMSVGQTKNVQSVLRVRGRRSECCYVSEPAAPLALSVRHPLVARCA